MLRAALALALVLAASAELVSFHSQVREWAELGLGRRAHCLRNVIRSACRCGAAPACSVLSSAVSRCNTVHMGRRDTAARVC